jgi:hypothetical protein
LRINADSTTNEHTQPIFKTEAKQQGLAAEEHNGQLRVSILEREVEMPRRRGAIVGYLTLYPNIGVFLLKFLADLLDKLAHWPNATPNLRRLKAEV